MHDGNRYCACDTWHVPAWPGRERNLHFPVSKKLASITNINHLRCAPAPSRRHRTPQTRQSPGPRSPPRGCARPAPHPAVVGSMEFSTESEDACSRTRGRQQQIRMNDEIHWWNRCTAAVLWPGLPTSRQVMSGSLLPSREGLRVSVTRFRASSTLPGRRGEKEKDGAVGHHKPQELAHGRHLPATQAQPAARPPHLSTRADTFCPSLNLRSAFLEGTSAGEGHRVCMHAVGVLLLTCLPQPGRRSCPPRPCPPCGWSMAHGSDAGHHVCSPAPRNGVVNTHPPEMWAWGTTARMVEVTWHSSPKSSARSTVAATGIPGRRSAGTGGRSGQGAGHGVQVAGQPACNSTTLRLTHAAHRRHIPSRLPPPLPSLV